MKSIAPWSHKTYDGTQSQDSNLVVFVLLFRITKKTYNHSMAIVLTYTTFNFDGRLQSIVFEVRWNEDRPMFPKFTLPSYHQFSSGVHRLRNNTIVSFLVFKANCCPGCLAILRLFRSRILRCPLHKFVHVF